MILYDIHITVATEDTLLSIIHFCSKISCLITCRGM